ncbi:TonB-dependent receptor plug domain-containing protein [Malaciobacter marinus]|uniref:TonB-dependent receptor plug domain-containing protein n=1 Tax=Malaciobacter marinus TaxID=505249 RepID=UPI003B0048E9
MKKLIIFIFIFFNTLNAQNLDSLLKNYKETSEKSLQTVDENLGHVFVYSQKDIRLMQYTKLSDILKELPLINFNHNRYGIPSLSLAGTKTTVSGFFRFFINDHEISSVHAQSPFLSWGNLPLDFVDYIEVYYGDSSFALGNDTGIYFIRIYTKKAYKENASELRVSAQKQGTNSQSIVHSQTFENGWSYLTFLKNLDSNKDANYKSEELKNHSKRRYFYLDISNDKTDINIGYADVKKDNFMGLSLDVVPNEGEIKSKDFFIDFTRKFLYDNSLKLSLSLDINTRKYYEENDEGIGLIPVLDLKNMGMTIPKKFKEDLTLKKFHAHLSKTHNYKNNSLLAGINFSKKKYEVNNRKTVNFLNQTTNVGEYHDFDEENIYSLLLQDKLKINEKLSFVANAKFDRYERSGFLDDTSEELYRIGAIFTPFDNFGLKAFYTKTFLPPSFYDVDSARKDKPYLNTQKYNFYTLEGVYTTTNSKYRVKYSNVKINDFIYFSPIGTMNIDHTIKSEGLIFNYEYLFENNDKFEISYYTTKLSEELNNSNKGGYVKYMGKRDKWEYFASLIYKNSYSYLDVDVDASYDLNLGATYYFSDDLSLSIKGINILDKSTESLYKDGFPGDDFAFEDHGKNFNISMKWVF